MDYKIYTETKNSIKDNLLFKLSQIGFGLCSDLLFTNRISLLVQDVDLVKNLKTGDKIFISSTETNIDMKKFVEIIDGMKIKLNFFLMNEPNVSHELIKTLLPYSLHIFCQNNNYDHPQVHCMPIGIRDCENVFEGHKGFSHRYLYEQGLKRVNKDISSASGGFKDISSTSGGFKDILCLLCFSFSHEERYRCYNILKDKEYVLNLNDRTYEHQPSALCGKVPVWLNYEYTHKSYYVLSPRGTGEDCHRFYEAIYLDSIPIVKRTNTVFDKLYNIFPCLVVNDWNEVTRELLESNLENCTQKLKDFKQKYPNIYTDISIIDELLLMT